ncbi:MAG: hypothetical protein Q4G28_05210 [Neisseria sp.]|nr:hypothetical protein [Neisseria sp.]
MEWENRIKRMKMNKWQILLITVSSLFIAHPASAKYIWDIERAERSCELQKNSILRERNGTPACTELKNLKRMQREYNHRQGIINYQADQRERLERQEREYRNKNPKSKKNGDGALQACPKMTDQHHRA